MKINKDITELILEYAGRYFRYENEFYKLPGIKFTDANWQKLKNGETSIEKMGAARVGAMLDVLFEPFELGLITMAQTNYYLSNKWKFTMSFPAFFDLYKKEVLIKWLEENPDDIIGGTGRIYPASGNMITNAYLELALESSIKSENSSPMLRMRFKNHSPIQKPIPTGRENRLKWVQENLEHIR